MQVPIDSLRINADVTRRNLIRTGALPAFLLGAKLKRIKNETVEEFEKCQGNRIGSDGSKDDTCSSGMAPEENANVTRLEPTTRARLNVVRRPSTPN
jgi:hypothetical protein